MSTATASAAAPKERPAQASFGPEFVEQLHREDRHAAAYVVSILLTVFTMALTAYTVIAYYAAYGN